MTQAFLSLSLAFFFFLFFFFTAIADDNSRQGCATRSAINTLERYPPLAAFSIHDDDSTCQRVVSLFPAMETGEREKNDHAFSAPAILNFEGGGEGGEI